MKVTVFIPAYNVEPYIPAAIASIQRQTFRDWELVIVDDCSTDDTYAVCQSYAAEDDRIKLYRNERNLGMMPNWVHGMQYCQGTYWGKLDADDVWAPEMLEQCVRLLDAYEDVGMVVTRYVNIDEQGTTIPQSEYFFPEYAKNQAVSFIPFVRSGVSEMFTHHIAQQGIGLIRRRIFDELGNFTLLPAGDTEMWFRIGAHYKIYCLDAVMHYHRVWANNFTRTQVLAQNKADQNLFDARSAIFDHYAAHGFIDRKLYRSLKHTNRYELNKALIATYRKQGKLGKALQYGAWNLCYFPMQTIRFYIGRLMTRL